MAQPDNSRLDDELELLHAIYPDQIDYHSRSRDLKYSDNSALLHLRLPETYPNSGFPDVISANDASKRDLRDRMKRAISESGVVEGEEALDVIIAAFQGIVGDINNDTPTTNDAPDTASNSAKQETKTVIIWLHHLLALGKRKLALNPSNSSPSISGITKPGYPGILLFTGPRDVVDEHVNELKQQNWQAFQVRYEEEGGWQLGDGGIGAGIREVETMAEVVKAVGSRKDEFLRAVGIK
ncbi:hypothetical protein GQ43DRAFT_105922 [Delitschia confertaspora ATCC 74209]|uniref:RWD domain-containing protein n=1 Tax=Delitschia confertaspora ATCC 74209 TaxID=1513339 RepID=A0A9P4JKA7_9PLEO|nr:hypothetical protein GQ43DRAFT_105922 [Delitschia confertaspora ATCC 74209]